MTPLSCHSPLSRYILLSHTRRRPSICPPYRLPPTMTLLARALLTMDGLTPGRAAEAPSLRQLPLPRVLHPQLTQCHRVVAAARPHLSVVIDGGADVAWHGRSLLDKLSTASTVPVNPKRTYRSSALSVREHSRRSMNGYATKTLFMRFEPLGFVVTQSRLKHFRHAHSAAKLIPMMLTWLVTNTSNVGASPNPSEFFIVVITSSSISTMFTSPIPNTHRYASVVKLDC